MTVQRRMTLAFVGFLGSILLVTGTAGATGNLDWSGVRVLRSSTVLSVKTPFLANHYKVLRGAAPSSRIVRLSDLEDDPEASDLDEALVNRCLDPWIQDQLRPFLGLGYWQPTRRYRGEITLLYGPISYRALIESQALETSTRGLRYLTFIATNGFDDERPRWPARVRGWHHDPESLEFVQGLLIELGPTLVELGLLAE